MKKLLSIFMIVTMLFSFVSCGSSNTTINCANCSAENDSNATFCSSCGNALNYTDNAQSNASTQQSNNHIETPNTETTEDSNRFVSGHYKVGVDMPAGTYIGFCEGKTPAYICATSDSNGDDIIFNNNFSNNCIFTIENGQYFEINRGYVLPYNDNIKVDTSDEGFYKVGVHIKAGEYKLINNTSTPGYYAIYNTPLSGDEEIIANDNFENSSYVTVNDGQYLLLNRCYLSYVGPGKPQNYSNDSNSSINSNTTQSQSSQRNWKLTIEGATISIEANDPLKDILNSNVCSITKIWGKRSSAQQNCYTVYFDIKVTSVDPDYPQFIGELVCYDASGNVVSSPQIQLFHLDDVGVGGIVSSHYITVPDTTRKIVVK